MLDEEKSIRVDLCSDHFERLLRSDVCVNCPSRPENEAVCRAMSAMHTMDDENVIRSIVSDIKVLQRTISKTHKTLGELQKVQSHAPLVWAGLLALGALITLIASLV